MRKGILIATAIMLILSLASCGGIEQEAGTTPEVAESISPEKEYCGTWEISSVEIEGSKFTADEVSAMGDDSLTGVGLVIKEGGKACLLENGTGDIVDWSITSNGIKIGVIECTIVDGLICIENNDIVMCFEKVSDEQTIPVPEKTNELTKPTSEETPTPAISFDLVAGEAGEYGKYVTFNEGTEFEETFYAYYIPAGVYTVTNVGEYVGQISVYSNGIHVTEEGWEEPAESGDVALLDVNESTTITIRENQYVEIHEPDHFRFEAQ